MPRKLDEDVPHSVPRAARPNRRSKIQTHDRKSRLDSVMESRFAKPHATPRRSTLVPGRHILKIGRDSVVS